MNLSQFAAQLSSALIPVIAAGLTGLIGVAIALLSAKVKARFGEQAQAKTDEYLTILQDVADHTVITLQQSTVDHLKASGQWDAETAGRVKAEAVKVAVESLGALKDQIESHTLLDVPKYLGTLIEAALHDRKQYGAVGQFVTPLMISNTKTPAPTPAPEPKPVDPTPVTEPAPAPETPVTPAPAPVDQPPVVQG